MMRLVLFLCAWVLLVPVTAAAQDNSEDRGFLIGLLERSLGGDGRTVRINGFAGALSSRATIDQITVADTDGVWLTLDGVEIGWNRSALFRGAIEIAELRAARIDLPRLPLPAPNAVPSPEATPFALPDLPASLEIGQMTIDTVSLGAPVLGEAAAFALTGSASLVGGAGDANLRAQRLDGPTAQFNVMARYANDTRDLALDLDLTEDQNGLISGLLSIPERPSVALRVNGAGLLSDFAAELDLRTDGVQRLSGTLGLQSAEDGPMSFDADLNGDVSALFVPEYAAFFGPDVSLKATGNQTSGGEISLDTFTVDTRAMKLSGRAVLGADGWPALLDIDGQIADPTGAPVVLPTGDTPVQIDRASLVVDFDASTGDALKAQIDLSDVDHPMVKAAAMSLALDGTIQGAAGAVRTLDTTIDLNTQALAFADPALQQAIGATVRGTLGVFYTADTPLTLRDMALRGADWQIAGDARIDSLSESLSTAFDVELTASDLNAFAALAGLDLNGSGVLSARGSAALGGFFDVAVTGHTDALSVGIAQADTLLQGRTALDLAARRDGDGTFLDKLTLANPAVSVDATAQLQSGASTAKYAIRLEDAGQLSDAVSGPLTLDGTAQQTDETWDVATRLAGPLDATAQLDARVAPDRIGIDLTADLPDLAPLVPQLTGGAQITASATQENGVWAFETAIDGPNDSTANVAGTFDDKLSARYLVEVPDISPFVPGVDGPVGLDGRVSQVTDGWTFDTKLTGPFNSAGTVQGDYLNARLNAQFDVAMPDAGAVAPGITGPLAAKGTLRQTDAGWAIDTTATGPYASTASVTGTYSPTDTNARYRLSVPNIAPLAPGVSGPLDLSGTVQQLTAGWALTADARGPYASTATVTGAYVNDRIDARYNVALPNIGALVPQLNGAAAVTGTATQVARGFDITANLSGPAGTTARVQGLVGSDGQLALDATGQAQLGLANPFLEPRNVAGVANFDLTIDGPPALGSVSGRVTTQGTRMAAPNLPLSFNDITAAIDLRSGQASLDVDAGVTDGGVIRIDGPVTLSGLFPAQIDVALDNVALVDPALYTSTVDGNINLRGPLTGGARISGTLNVGETNVHIPASGISTFGAIPEITHIGATRPVMRTRDRAGLTQETAESSSSGPAYPLDITINAPSRIFVRGRGLDAELGGALRLTGTSSDTFSTGQFDLIRGRLDILAKRFELDEGRVQLQGRFDPYLRFVVATTTSTGTARIVLEGPADDPEVTFEATPEAPQDQVLAQIFFGRDISQLSAFQALQLASAVASLAGRGGEGVVSQLRGSFDLDDLDVTTDDEGNAALRAGKYISDNVYTDVTVGGADGPEVSLNIDLTPNVTVRGTVASDSNTGIGIFIEKDY
ncbi:translocation/assembly module TamB domain-containing protein [uncultured Tateyamaria sp.]|uniref:translocation/assembly module TamB domain-containing protein n=2 Tax=uncultured Tateyamaria sp. TaxID=455651 RepID=UPI00260B4295|nr:translocation/assembly module TamB domain-containing protein [uncultured Tateyamaria sp.]